MDNSTTILELADLCWAKLNPRVSLWHHMYETAILSKTFLEQSSYKGLVGMFKECFREGATDKEIINVISAFVGMHDIGKAWYDFQYNGLKELDSRAERENWIIEINNMGYGCPMSNFRHEAASAYIMKKLTREYTALDSTLREAVGTVYLNHHLSRDETSVMMLRETVEDINEEGWKLVQKELIKRMFKEFGIERFPSLKAEKTQLFEVVLLGFLYRCDWIASSLFTGFDRDIMSKKEYQETVREISEGYVRSMKMECPKVDVSGLKMKDIFTDLSRFSLRPLQEKAESIGQTDATFDCVIVEDLTGAGKTEAGLYLAFQAMQKRGKQGIYMGLPTNTTEETMNPRFQQAIDTVYGKAVYEVGHATGSSWLREENIECEKEEKRDRMYSASTKEKKLMVPFVTGTVDQIEIAALKRRFGMISMVDLMNKVVVIDEMHAYDAYMRGILLVTLKWLKEAGAPVIIMSATLPNFIKEDIHKVYSEEPFVKEEAYPLLTVYKNGHRVAHKIHSNSTPRTYDVALTQGLKDYNAICRSAKEKIKNGGNLVIIMDTVSCAKELYRKVKEEFKDIPVMLFQGQSTEKNKAEFTERLISLYGKEGKEKGNRPYKSIVIATQIVEQSIDVDFDYMISELAPIDLLLQRFGRWHRHSDKGTIREKGYGQSPIEIHYAGTSEKMLKLHYVYKDFPTVLRNTVVYLQKHQTLEVPKQSREMVEAVYQLESYKEEEEAVKESQEVKALIATIDCPEEHGSLPFEKRTLMRSQATRLEAQKRYDIAIVPRDVYEVLEKGCCNKTLAAKIRREYLVSLGEKEANKALLFGYREGEGWLKECYIIPENKNIGIDKEYGIVFDGTS